MTPTHPTRRFRGTARLLGAAALLALTVTGLGAGLDAGHADGQHADRAGHTDRAGRAHAWKERAERLDRPVPAPTTAPAKPPAPAPAPKPDPRTIVQVDGNAADGFEIRHLDGTWDYPPTDSEAAAECSEYDTRVTRAVCRADVSRWYRDLADLQRSLAYAYAH